MVIFEVRKKKNKKIQKMYDDSMEELDSFFRLNWKKHKPSIILINKRKEIDLLKGRKTPDWNVGWVEKHKLYILSPNNYEKESSHKYSHKEYRALIKHELCHLFFAVITNRNSCPLWLNEGTAVYLSGQNEFKKPAKKFKYFLKYYDDADKHIYYESGFAVQHLVERFGKKNFMKLLKGLTKTKSKDEFNKLFKKIYGSNSTYKFFNDLLK